MRPTARCGLVLILGALAVVAARPIVAASTLYCGLGQSGQSCAEFPIVTHWAISGGVGQFDLAGTDPDPRRLQPPSYQNYSGMTTDTYGPSGPEVDDFIRALEQATGVPVMLYNYDYETPDLSDTALHKLVPGLNKVQVLHNVWIPVLPPRLTTLFTFIFPPGWQPTQHYPLVLSGNGGLVSNNLMFFGTEQTRAIAVGVARSTLPGRTGFIAALSNAGGRESLGGHDNAIRDLPPMLTFMHGYGVDQSRVVHFGGSRGGGTALLWGENPDLSSAYSSIGVFALVPASHVGYISQESLASYQGLHGTVAWFNDETADRYSRTPRLIDVNPSPLVQNFLGQDKPWLADRPQEDYSQDTWRKSSSGYLSRLQGLQAVVLGAGTHDAGAALPMVLQLDRTLRERWHVPHLTCLTLRTGHGGMNPLAGNDVDDCLRAELGRFLDAILTGQPYTVPDTRRYFIATDLTNHPIGTAVALPAQTTLPFAVTVPYRLAPFQWAVLAACGQTGTPYTATLANENVVSVFTVSKVFGQGTTSDFDFDNVGEPDPECDVIRLDQPGGWGSLSPGTYRWSFTFNGQAIAPGNLSYQGGVGWGRPTVATTIITDLTESQPSRQNAVFDPVGFITMGVDAF